MNDKINKAKNKIKSMIGFRNKVMSYEIRNNQLIASLRSGVHFWVKI